jgi:Phytanoyl-CoA dioxygenase (PhyH)
MAILSEADHTFFREHGYLAVPDILPLESCQAAIAEMCAFLDVDQADPKTWYRKNLGSNGIVPIHHPQVFWNNRQHPKIHEVFSELYGTEKLWVTMDRGSFKPPFRPQLFAKRDDCWLHWDVDPRKAKGVTIQGLVYLTDTEAHQGTFEGIPSIYRSLPTWLRQHKMLYPLEPRIKPDDIVGVSGRAGTLVLWNALLPHRSGLNYTEKPRFVQYIAMNQAGNEQERQERVKLWKERRVPKYWRGWRYQIEPEPGEPAALDALGRKLLGLDVW